MEIGDREVKIGLLSIDPVTLPKTRPFAVGWERRSPTSVDVTVPVKANAAPFLLVFGDAYHPEWQASVNGKLLRARHRKRPLQRLDRAGLPQGGTIALRFIGQRYYIVAGIVSLIALDLLITLAIKPELWPLRSSNP